MSKVLRLATAFEVVKQPITTPGYINGVALTFATTTGQQATLIAPDAATLEAVWWEMCAPSANFEPDFTRLQNVGIVDKRQISPDMAITQRKE